MLMSIIFSALLMVVVIGLIVYFTVFYHKDKNADEVTKQVAKMAPLLSVAFATTLIRSTDLRQ